MLLASDIVLPPACLYNPGNAIFPRRRRRHLFLRTYAIEAIGEGASVYGDGSGSHHAATGRFRSFIEKSVGKPGSSRRRRRLLRDVGGSEKDPSEMARKIEMESKRERTKGEGGDHLAISFPEKRSPLSRRARWPLGEGGLASVFLLHTSKEMTRLCMFRTEFDEARNTTTYVKTRNPFTKIVTYIRTYPSVDTFLTVICRSQKRSRL